MCAKGAVDFYEWAKSDSRVVGITPWNWGGCASCRMGEIGARDQPATRAAWLKIGGEIKHMKADDGDVRVTLPRPPLANLIRDNDNENN